MNLALDLDLNRKYSLEEFCNLSDVCCELVNGMIKLMAGVNKFHVSVSKRIFRLFDSAFKEPDYFIFYAPFDVIFDESNVYQPDLGLVIDQSKVKENGIYGAPDLIVEIISPSSITYDTRHKFDIYEKFKVKEYWIVEPKSEYVKVFKLDNDKYDEGTLYDYSTDKNVKIKISFLEDVELSLSDIFKSK